MPERTTFQGFARDDGTAGVRNHVLVLSSVVCANRVVERIATAVPEAVAIVHPLGCGQMGSDREQTLWVLADTASHPNVALALVVGLGCEGVQAAEVVQGAAARGRTVHTLSVQSAGGPSATVEEGVALLRRLAVGPGAARGPRPVSDLVLGVADAAVLDPNGRALVEAFLGRGGRVLEAIRPNGRGIELAYAAPMPAGASYVTMEAGSGEAETITGLAASGAQVILARGDDAHIGTHPICPVLRVAPAGPSHHPAYGGAWEERSPEAWVDAILDVASGVPTQEEALGLESFAIGRRGPTV